MVALGAGKAGKNPAYRRVIILSILELDENQRDVISAAVSDEVEAPRR